MRSIRRLPLYAVAYFGSLMLFAAELSAAPRGGGRFPRDGDDWLGWVRELGRFVRTIQDILSGVKG